MSYAKAGLGFGIANGMAILSNALMDIEERQYRRQRQQEAAKLRLEELKRRDTERAHRDWVQKETWRRQDEARDREEAMGRETRYFNAERDMANLRSEGYDAFVEPPAISLTGDPTKPGGLRQTTTLPNVPRLVVGDYNPERDPSVLRTKAQGDYFLSKGYGPEGQLPPRPRTPDEPPDAWITIGGRRFPNNPEGEAAALAWNAQLNPPKESVGDEWIRELTEGSGTEQKPRRRFFGGGEAAADEREIVDDPALRALNTAHREGVITQEQHADALDRYRTGKVTADQILGWLTGS